MPWRKHLYKLDCKHAVDTLENFVFYTDAAGMWRVQDVTIEGRGFENHMSFPELWRGVRDEYLVKLWGIEGGRFCHAAEFICGNTTKEGALDMAWVALR